MRGVKKWDDEENGDRREERERMRQLGILTRLDREESPEEDMLAAAQFANVVELSDEQQQAYEHVVAWFEQCRRRNPEARGPCLLTMGGYAGVGKTTLLGIIAVELCRRHRVAFCTLTGKASTILERSLRAQGVMPEYCGTIHRMMYEPNVDEDTGAVTGWEKAPALDYDLIVIDEASMLSSSLLSDMLTYGIPILAVGDHGQLPPVGEDVGIMSRPHIRLETVRRQALDNPIIALASIVREGGDWLGFLRACGDVRLKRISPMDITMVVMDAFVGFQDRPFSEDPLVLCGTNRTRALLNRAARSNLTRKDLVVEGERIICLKNAYLSGMLLANGFRGKVTGFGYSGNPAFVSIKAVFPDENLELRDGLACKKQFGADHTFKTFTEVSPTYRRWSEVGLLIDYGYALTVHKAQGSQADNAILVVERFGDPTMFRRWLYTACTRASRTLTVAV